MDLIEARSHHQALTSRQFAMIHKYKSYRGPKHMAIYFGTPSKVDQDVTRQVVATRNATLLNDRSPPNVYHYLLPQPC